MDGIELEVEGRLKANADKVRADWDAAAEAEFASETKGKKKREGKKKK